MTTAKSSWSDIGRERKDFNSACQNISNVAYEIESLARSFYRTGNEAVGDELSDYACRLHEAQKAITLNDSQRIARELRETQEGAGRMLVAFAAGAGDDPSRVIKGTGGDHE